MNPELPPLLTEEQKAAGWVRLTGLNGAAALNCTQETAVFIMNKLMRLGRDVSHAQRWAIAEHIYNKEQKGS